MNGLNQKARGSFAQLTGPLRFASTVTLFPMALSNRTGTASLEMMPPTGRRGRQFVGGGSDAVGSAQDLLLQDDRPVQLPARARHVIDVPICQLDALLPPPYLVPYMKVDAQGFDTLVLRGAAKMLAEHRVGAVAFEFSPFLMPGRESEAHDALVWLESLHYACMPCWRSSAGSRQEMDGQWSISRYVAHFRNSSRYDDVVCRPRELVCSGRADTPFDRDVCGHTTA
jgi:hypothetical protein